MGHSFFTETKFNWTSCGGVWGAGVEAHEAGGDPQFTSSRPGGGRGMVTPVKLVAFLI